MMDGEFRYVWEDMEVPMTHSRGDGNQSVGYSCLKLGTEMRIRHSVIIFGNWSLAVHERLWRRESRVNRSLLNPVFQEEGTYQSTYKETEMDQSELWRKLNEVLKKQRKCFKEKSVQDWQILWEGLLRERQHGPSLCNKVADGSVCTCKYGFPTNVFRNALRQFQKTVFWVW